MLPQDYLALEEAIFFSHNVAKWQTWWRRATLIQRKECELIEKQECTALIIGWQGEKCLRLHTGYEKVNVSMASRIGIDREQRAVRVREAERRGMTMEMALSVHVELALLWKVMGKQCKAAMGRKIRHLEAYWLWYNNGIFPKKYLEFELHCYYSWEHRDGGIERHLPFIIISCIFL